METAGAAALLRSSLEDRHGEPHRPPLVRVAALHRELSKGRPPEPYNAPVVAQQLKGRQNEASIDQHSVCNLAASSRGCKCTDHPRYERD